MSDTFDDDQVGSAYDDIEETDDTNASDDDIIDLGDAEGNLGSVEVNDIGPRAGDTEEVDGIGDTGDSPPELL